MPLYERRDADHEVVERVQTVAGSRNDQRLAATDGWKVVTEDGDTSAPAAPAAPAPVAKRTPAVTPAKEV